MKKKTQKLYFDLKKMWPYHLAKRYYISEKGDWVHFVHPLLTIFESRDQNNSAESHIMKLKCTKLDDTGSRKMILIK